MWCSQCCCLCSESVKCLPGMASKFFLTFCYHSNGSLITGMNTHNKFHILGISIHKLFILLSFLLPFAKYFCLLVLPHISVCMSSLFCCYYIWPICHDFSICVPPGLQNTVISSCSHIARACAQACVCVCVCVFARARVYTIWLSFWSLVFCILSNVNVQKLSVSSLMSPNFSHRYGCSLSSSFSSKSRENCLSILFPRPFCCLLCFAVLYLSCSSLQFSLEASRLSWWWW